ncbi:MAG: alkaline phosphatase family protein [Vulcanimicrobiaceae bacterium]
MPNAGRIVTIVVALTLIAARPSIAPALMRPAGVVFSAPAGHAPAGSTGGPSDPFEQILPSGRIVKPSGKSVVVGMNALGIALSPDGRFAIVSNDDEREAKEVSAFDGVTTGGFSLAVVDTSTMAVLDRYRAPNETFFVGVAALRDPAAPGQVLVLASGGPSDTVYAFDLDSYGRLTPDAHHVIPMPDALDPAFANAFHAFPSTIVPAADGVHAYVVNNLAFSVAQIDLRTRTIAAPPVKVGFFPLGAALSLQGLLVANEGLMSYGVLPSPAPAPPFATPSSDPVRAQSLSILGVAAGGVLAAGRQSTVQLDRSPDGLAEVGGVQPSAIAALRQKPYAFIAMSGVDRVAVVTVRAPARVVGGTELRLYDRGPYGTQPDALALSPDERRLYVALAGIDAIAVLDVSDPPHPHRVGLIPTGWYPSALALSENGRYLFVANAKGLAQDPGFKGDQPSVLDAHGRILQVVGDSNSVWSTLERIDLTHTDIRESTRLALSYLRTVEPMRADKIVPQRFGLPNASPIKHVVLILEENKTYDSMLGDLTDAAGKPYGPGDPAYVSFDRSVTPNLHALAQTYALAGNFFADAEESDAGHQFVAGGIASVYTERTLLVKNGRRPLVNKNEDPEDYPRAGYVFQSLLLNHRTFRDYGDYVRVSGYDEGEARDPKTDDPHFVDMADTRAATEGLGGLYSLDVPAPLALDGNVDLNYPGWNLRIRDERRAREFIKDFDALEKAGQMPEFTHIWLPADHGGAGKNIPPLSEEVADGDRALGTIVEYLTHLPEWSSTAIFILPDDAQSTRDHVNEHRSYALVVSPYAKRGYVGMRHLSTVSVLKTEEEILGLPALSLGDALAGDMRDFFTTTAAATPYEHIPVGTQTASREGRRIAALLERTDQRRPDADERAPALIDLSLRADRLAKRQRAYPPARYERLQRALYERALALVR